jgi:glycosyltransferase involved in cell wall biosynthesis
MHILVVAYNFPSPANPHHNPFVGEQVRLLCERTESIKRITVLSPTVFFRRMRSNQTSSPSHYQIAGGRCDVHYPRYLKPPGKLFLASTIRQWCRLLERTVTRFVDTDPVSVIHANSGSITSWSSICVAKRHRIPSVVTYQGSDVHTILARREKGWQLCRDSFRLADLNLLVSRSLEPILRSHAEPAGRCEVLLRGVDRKKFFPASKPVEKPRVLFVGRVEEDKGVFDLLAAWAQVRGTVRDAFLTVAGPDRTGGRFLTTAGRFGVQDSIRLLGPVSHSTIPELMRNSRILCLPSHKEGTPNCLTEALSCGLPVVATRVGGIPDVVEHQRHGLLVDRGDVEGLAEALVTLLSDQARYSSQSSAAQAFASKHLDARKSVARLAEFYQELVAARRSEHGVPSHSKALA